MDTIRLATPHAHLTGNAPFVHQRAFEPYGVRVELVNTNATGGPIVEAVLSRAADYTHVLGAPIPAAVEGRGLKYIGSFQNAGFELMVRPEVTSLKQLEGKKVALSSGMMNFNFQYAMRQAGADPDAIVPVRGGLDDRAIQAVKNGEIDALMTPMPAPALLAGLKAILRVGDVSPVPVYGLMTRDDVLRERPDEVRRVLQGLMEAVNDYIRDRDLGIELVAQLGLPRDVATVAYDWSRGHMQPLGPLPESVQREWVENAKQLAKVSGYVPLSRAFDFCLIRELQPLCQ